MARMRNGLCGRERRSRQRPGVSQPTLRLPTAQCSSRRRPSPPPSVPASSPTSTSYSTHTHTASGLAPSSGLQSIQRSQPGTASSTRDRTRPLARLYACFPLSAHQQPPSRPRRPMPADYSLLPTPSAGGASHHSPSTAKRVHLFLKRRPLLTSLLSLSLVLAVWASVFPSHPARVTSAVSSTWAGKTTHLPSWDSEAGDEDDGWLSRLGVGSGKTAGGAVDKAKCEQLWRDEGLVAVAPATHGSAASSSGGGSAPTSGSVDGGAVHFSLEDEIRQGKTRKQALQDMVDQTKGFYVRDYPLCVPGPPCPAASSPADRLCTSLRGAAAGWAGTTSATSSRSVLGAARGRAQQEEERLTPPRRLVTRFNHPPLRPRSSTPRCSTGRSSCRRASSRARASLTRTRVPVRPLLPVAWRLSGQDADRRTVPSFAAFATMVNRGDAMQSDEWRDSPIEKQWAWLIPTEASRPPGLQPSATPKPRADLPRPSPARPSRSS